jgi:hypothetical protein
MAPEDINIGILLDMCVNDLSEFIEWQTYWSIWIIEDNSVLQPREISTVDFPPTGSGGGKPQGTDIIQDARFVEFLDGGRGIMRCAGFSIQFKAEIEDCNIDVFPAET